MFNQAYQINDPNEYVNVKLNDSTYFNPFQDANGNWYLSIEEVEEAGIIGLNLVQFEPIQNEII